MQSFLCSFDKNVSCEACHLCSCCCFGVPFLSHSLHAPIHFFALLLPSTLCFLFPSASLRLSTVFPAVHSSFPLRDASLIMNEFPFSTFEKKESLMMIPGLSLVSLSHLFLIKGKNKTNEKQMASYHTIELFSLYELMTTEWDNMLWIRSF